MNIYKDNQANTDKSEYWQDVENKVLDPKILKNEFGDEEFDSFSVKKNRRDFLKVMGFSVTALPLTGCIKIPVRKAVPYLYKNHLAIPGVANWFGTTIAGQPLLAKCREGRPIKIEGNDKSPSTMGGANPQMQASVLSLYDSYRYSSPLVKGKKLEWDEFDSVAKASLSQANGKEIILVSGPNFSPTEQMIIKEFADKYKATVVYYDPTENQAVLDAHESVFGTRLFPEYQLEQADYILSFGADFLATYGNDVAQHKQYSKRRNPNHPRGMSKHIQIEPIMTMTGMNSDKRYTRSLKDQRAILSALHSQVVGGASSAKLSETDKKLVAKLTQQLRAAASRSVVMSSDIDSNAQILVAEINAKLTSYGKTVFAYNKQFAKHSKNSDFNSAVARMNSGSVGAVLFLNTNPAYSFEDKDRFASSLAKVPFKLSFATAKDETSALCDFVAPNNHEFETWSDHQVTHNEFSFSQPVIQPLFGSRMASQTLLSFIGSEDKVYDRVKRNWKNNFYSDASNKAGAENFWNKSLHDGIAVVSGRATQLSPSLGNGRAATAALSKVKYTKTAVIPYQKIAIKDGSQSNNPWLQEMPDPVTKATWDNYVMINPAEAKAMGIKSGDVVEVKSKDYSIKIPAISQPGTAKGHYGIAVGYGRSVAGKVARGLGGNVFGFGYAEEVSLRKTGEHTGLAQTQTHHSMEGRDIIRETTFGEFKVDSKAGNTKKAKLVNIYPKHDQTGHQWAMAVDLNQCTGCSACIISCNAENNVPVVGRQEVANRREMHWMRLDRYYKGDENEPEVMNMPMLCQHCENAPCENVCPVLATVHSSDGINQQIYNRCVGTRYCANNCPYKVRRFNWFNYDRGDSMAKMVLNPDISQRSRGVMEKCSFCIQRIQTGKLDAKKERRPLKDGDIKVACQQSCPGDAIVFGDMNDENSRISQMLGHDRNYTVLRELNVKPRVSYLTKVRNKDS